MNFQEYTPLALRTAPPVESAWRDIEHCLFGLTTEIGEFTSEVKRIHFYCKEMSAEMVAHMREELGDTLWYLPVGLRGLASFGVNGLPVLSERADKNVRQAASSLPGCVEVLTMFAGAFAVEFHAERYVQGASYMQMGRALTGVLATVEHAALLLGTTGDQLRVDNIAKLRKRFPEGFSGEAAEARADVGGLGHRES